MVGIPGIGGISGPANSRQVQGQSDGPPPEAQPLQDQVVFSSGASAASDFLAVSESQQEARAFRLDQARANIEAGSYKLQEVVAMVASRISKFVG